MASDMMVSDQSGEYHLNRRGTFNQCWVWLVGHHFGVCDMQLITL